MNTVVMTHPKLDGEETAVTTQTAFDEVWSAKGWEIVTDDAPVAADEPDPEPIAPARQVVGPKSPPAQPLMTDPKIGA